MGIPVGCGGHDIDQVFPAHFRRGAEAAVERRGKSPLKQWKLTEEDWRNRGKRRAYEAAIEEMLEKTDTAVAPWTVVPAESKRYARIQVLDTVIAR